MNKITSRYIVYLSIFVIIPLIGCANTPRLEFESMPNQPKTDESRTTIAQLAENWADYDIHYSGRAGTVAGAQGILFDPKNDNKVLMPEGAWKKVEDKETLQHLMKWTASPSSQIGRLMKVLSPDGQFFGYLYLNIEANYAGLRVIDKNTIGAFPVIEDKF